MEVTGIEPATSWYSDNADHSAHKAAIIIIIIIIIIIFINFAVYIGMRFFSGGLRQELIFLALAFCASP